MWGPTRPCIFVTTPHTISIHGPRVGADYSAAVLILTGDTFQSTAPVWGPTRRATLARKARRISIHGPRVGADRCQWRCQNYRYNFNPRPPCGGRHRHINTLGLLHRFQSTAPVWGPTSNLFRIMPAPRYFNPRPPCGGRHNAAFSSDGTHLFQSTAPVWGPTRMESLKKSTDGFQSTAPVWGPTFRIAYTYQCYLISIHGPRVGADVQEPSSFTVWGNFNPRPPCGGRQQMLTKMRLHFCVFAQFFFISEEVSLIQPRLRWIRHWFSPQIPVRRYRGLCGRFGFAQALQD